MNGCTQKIFCGASFMKRATTECSITRVEAVQLRKVKTLFSPTRDETLSVPENLFSISDPKSGEQLIFYITHTPTRVISRCHLYWQQLVQRSTNKKGKDKE